MAKIKIKTPFKKDVVLVWKNRKVEVKGEEDALLYWEFLSSKGLYGKYGHIVDLEDCFFTDLVSAVANRVEPKNYSLDKEAKEQVELEVEEERRNPLPKGAMT